MNENDEQYLEDLGDHTRAEAVAVRTRWASGHERDARYYRSLEAGGPPGAAIADEARRWAEAHEATAARYRQIAAAGGRAQLARPSGAE